MTASDPTFATLVHEMTFHLWRGMGLRYFRDPRRLPGLEERSTEVLRTWRAMIDSLERS